MRSQGRGPSQCGCNGVTRARVSSAFTVKRRRRQPWQARSPTMSAALRSTDRAMDRPAPIRFEKKKNMALQMEPTGQVREECGWWRPPGRSGCRWGRKRDLSPCDRRLLWNRSYSRGRPGFDGGIEACRCVSSSPTSSQIQWAQTQKPTTTLSSLSQPKHL